MPHANSLGRPALWFERKFDTHTAIGLAPNVCTRVAGTVARLRALGTDSAAVARAAERVSGGGWTIAEHVGHMGDLEPIWFGRLDDYDAGASTLRPADLTNQATHTANHSAQPLDRLIERFAERREALVARVSGMSPAEWDRAALHPRLETSLRLIDFMVFVAEHDDHHLAEIAWLRASS